MPLGPSNNIYCFLSLWEYLGSDRNDKSIVGLRILHCVLTIHHYIENTTPPLWSGPAPVKLLGEVIKRTRSLVDPPAGPGQLEVPKATLVLRMYDLIPSGCTWDTVVTQNRRAHQSKKWVLAHLV